MTDVLNSLGQEILKLPCAAELHHPFALSGNANDIGVYGHVRTSSWEFDGCGGRTDAHDVYSALWAAVLRANGAASSQLVDIEGWCGFPELESRVLIFHQLSSSIGAIAQRSEQAKAQLSAHSAWAWHALSEVFGWEHLGKGDDSWSDQPPPFCERIRHFLSWQPTDTLMGVRKKPDWMYFSDHKHGISIVVFPLHCALPLRLALAAYEPEALQGQQRTAIVAGGLYNAIPNNLIRRGVKLLHAVEHRGSVPWKGAGAHPLDRAIALIPLESHCVMVGMQTVVIQRGNCGLRSYEAERTKFLQRRAAENSIFHADISFTWSTNLAGDRFEELIYALLQKEQGVEWVRQAGPTHEPDGGRDLIAFWTLPPAPGSSAKDPQADPPFRPRRVLVQVKASRSSVGKSKVRDIRDTLERYDADGYFLVAFPQPARSLVEHLELLPQNGMWCDWWDRAQIETRLRKHVELCSRFDDLVQTTLPTY